jgi:hypothetical protein
MWVATHMCMKATTLGISLYSYLYPKLAKTICLSYYLLCFLFNRIIEEGGTGCAWKPVGRVRGHGWGGRRGKNDIYTCKLMVNVKMIK